MMPRFKVILILKLKKCLSIFLYVNGDGSFKYNATNYNIKNTQLLQNIKFILYFCDNKQ